MDKQDYEWAVLVSQLENNSTLTERQVWSICSAIASQHINATNKISMLKQILNSNHKQS